MGTTGNKVDFETWNKLLEAYREDPGNFSNAARHAGVQRRTARRAWDVGYPDRPWGGKSIRDMIRDEAELARSRTQLELEREELNEDKELLESERSAEAARQRAIAVRVEEAQLISGARAITMNAFASASKAAQGLSQAMTKLGGSLISKAMSADELSMKDMTALSALLRRYSSTLRELTQAGQTAMEMERLYLGEPTSVIGVMTDLDAMPIEDLVKMAGYQDEVLTRARERGLVVLDGGLKKDGSHKP